MIIRFALQSGFECELFLQVFTRHINTKLKTASAKFYCGFETESRETFLIMLTTRGKFVLFTKLALKSPRSESMNRDQARYAYLNFIFQVFHSQETKRLRFWDNSKLVDFRKDRSDQLSTCQCFSLINSTRYLILAAKTFLNFGCLTFSAFSTDKRLRNFHLTAWLPFVNYRFRLKTEITATLFISFLQLFLS